MKRLIFFLTFLIFPAMVAATGWYFFGPVETGNQEKIITVSEDENKLDVIIKLKDEKLIRNAAVFMAFLQFKDSNKEVAAGGYKLNGNMNAWQIADKITAKPDLIWVTIRGFRASV